MQKVFGCDWERTAFAFGNTIYSKYQLPDHLIVHESVHLEQQRHSIIGAWLWLGLYLLSKRFRYRMELQAYRKQWQFFKTHYTFRCHNNFIGKIAGDLSGKLYGNIVTYEEAVRAIKQ
jgi:hypothetical protein